MECGQQSANAGGPTAVLEHGPVIKLKWDEPFPYRCKCDEITHLDHWRTATALVAHLADVREGKP